MLRVPTAVRLLCCAVLLSVAVPAGAAASTLVGNSAVQTARDGGTGTSEAFGYTAAASGSASTAQVYLDSTDGVQVGVYADANGKPGARLAIGSLSSNPAGWVSIPLSSAVSITAGTRYWLAIAATSSGASVSYRDTGGTGATLDWAGRGLADPYSTSAQWASNPASVYLPGSLSSGTGTGTGTGTGSGTPPTAAFTVTPAAPTAGQSARFDGSGSTCAVTPCSYSYVDVGPSGTASYPLSSAQSFSFTFSSAGTKYVQLSVTDGLGRVSKLERDVVVSAPAPSGGGTPPPASPVGAPTPAGTTCSQTLAPGANVNAALQSAPAGATVCLSAGAWSGLTLSGIAPSSPVTLAATPGQSVTLPWLTIQGPGVTKNLTVEGFFFGGRVQALGSIAGGVTFLHNTSENISHDFAYYLYANANGTGNTQTGISFEDNQIDHVGSCLEVDGGSGIEANVTFSHNVCGPGIGLGAKVATDPSHYVQMGGVNTATVDNNAFEGPMDPNYVAAALHNNVFHVFGDAANVDFSNNIMWHTQSRGETILIHKGALSSISVQNNLDVEDPACMSNYNCYSYAQHIYATHGLVVKNNTIVDSHWTTSYGSTDASSYPSSQGMTLQDNIVEPAAAACGTNCSPDYYVWQCASACTTDHNVSADASVNSTVPGAGNVANWSPGFSSTTWTPTNGAPWTPPPAGYYRATGLLFAAGYQGTIGP